MKMSDICNYKDIYACTMSFLYNVFSYLVRSACDLETKPHTHDDCSLFSHREIWEKTSVLSFSHFFLVSFSLVNRENPIFFIGTSLRSSVNVHCCSSQDGNRTCLGGDQGRRFYIMLVYALKKKFNSRNHYRFLCISSRFSLHFISIITRIEFMI